MPREQIVPAARQQDGFEGIYLLLDRESGRSLSITLRETEEEMRASEEAAKRVRNKNVRDAGATIVGIERYEGALAELDT
ncbi:hypothetical protein BH24ACT22_BH24ACT22_04800 [soil metagenome]